jgi:tetratricopeptide (TPR) repeat protein
LLACAMIATPAYADRDNEKKQPPKGPKVHCVDNNPLAPCDSPKGELFQTAKTSTSRAKLSEFLVAPAKKAAKARDWAKAIPLYQALVVARGPASPEAKQLATLWTLAGQNERASEAWAQYGNAVTNKEEHATALVESKRLADVEDPFADKLALASMTAEAKKAFAAGRAAFAAKRYGDALVNFHMGLALAPDLPGFLRELGSTYDKLGAQAQKREFYLRYLVQRPLGGNADVVRAELAKNKNDQKQLGTLLITSSLPCAELWVNRQRVGGKLPTKGIVVAPGSYKGLCFNPKYEMALFEYANVEAGKPALMSFTWAIVQNKLEKPYGRIALENPKSPGLMIDLGITSSEIGVAAPADGRKLKMILKDDSGVRVEERSVKIEPGQKLVVTW